MPQCGQEKYLNQVSQRYLKLSPPELLQTLREECLQNFQVQTENNGKF